MSEAGALVGDEFEGAALQSAAGRQEKVVDGACDFEFGAALAEGRRESLHGLVGGEGSV